MDFRPYIKYSSTLIETGTHIGTSIQAALDAGFSEIRSVELYEPSYLYSLKRFEGDKRVKLFFGKSTDLLPEMIKDIPIPSVFWLDAHPSGPGTAMHEQWLEGDPEADQALILRREVAIIIEHGKHVILIDDQNTWDNASHLALMIENKYPGDYSFSMIDEVFHDVFHKEKILVCLP